MVLGPASRSRLSRAALLGLALPAGLGLAAGCSTPEDSVLEDSVLEGDGVVDEGHGWRLSSALGSPDGRYLAYQVYSSGGHQPYRAPVFVVSLDTGETVELERVLEWQGTDSCVTEDDGPLRWSPEGRLHFFTCERREHRYDPRSGAVEALEPVEPVEAEEAVEAER